MQRSHWSFEYTAAKLATAALEKKSFHKSRVSFWEEAKTRVMDEMKDSGIEFSESEGASSGNYTHGNGPQVMVRNDLQRKLTECHNKIKEHCGKVNEYDGWVQVLSANPEARFQLHVDDYLFFFGK